MNIIKIFFIATFFCGITTITQAQTNFTGNWKRNDAQSDAGELSPNSVPITVTITQDADQIQIQSVVRDGKGELHKTNDALPFNSPGKIQLNEATKVKETTSVKWVDDKRLLYRTIITGSDGNPTQDAKETLSMNGDQLEIDVELLYEGENYTLKEVFDKVSHF